MIKELLYTQDNYKKLGKNWILGFLDHYLIL